MKNYWLEKSKNKTIQEWSFFESDIYKEFIKIYGIKPVKKHYMKTGDEDFCAKLKDTSWHI